MFTQGDALLLQCGGASFFYFYEEVLTMGKNTRIYNKFEYESN